MSEPLRERFAGCMLAGMLGDVIGAVVEGESPRYIRKTFASVEDMLALRHTEEVLGGEWLVGRFTDDTQMTLCVADWLLEDPGLDGGSLMARFSEAYRPARRYGSGTARILEAYPEHAADWRALATLMFPGGSYGNGSAMRVGPIGCYFHDDLDGLARTARLSSETTHSHPLAVQGATLQAAAVAAAVTAASPFSRERFLRRLELALEPFESHGRPPSAYREPLQIVSQGMARNLDPADLAEQVGTGIEALQAVPMAIACFLAHPESFEQVISGAVFLGGDTDTIASMAGALSGAYLGVGTLPRAWLARVREEEETPGAILRRAYALHERWAARRPPREAGARP